MKAFMPPKFTLASSLDTELEWIYHNQSPRAVMVIRTPDDPALPATTKVSSEEGEEIAVVQWIDAEPDASAHKALLKEALAFLEALAEAYEDEEDLEEDD